MRKDYHFTIGEQVRLVLGLTLIAFGVSVYAVGLVISVIPRI